MQQWCAEVKKACVRQDIAALLQEALERPRFSWLPQQEITCALVDASSTGPEAADAALPLGARAARARGNGASLLLSGEEKTSQIVGLLTLLPDGRVVPTLPPGVLQE